MAVAIVRRGPALIVCALAICLLAAVPASAAQRHRTAHTLKLKMKVPKVGDISIAVARVKLPKGVAVKTALHHLRVTIPKRPAGVGVIITASKLKKGQALFVAELVRPKRASSRAAPSAAAAQSGGGFTLTLSDSDSVQMFVDHIAADVVEDVESAGDDQFDFCTDDYREDYVAEVISEHVLDVLGLPADASPIDLTQAVIDILCGDFDAKLAALLTSFGYPVGPPGTSSTPTPTTPLFGCTFGLSIVMDPGAEYLLSGHCPVALMGVYLLDPGQTSSAYKTSVGGVTCQPMPGELDCTGTFPATAPFTIQLLTDHPASCGLGLGLRVTTLAGQSEMLGAIPCGP